MAKKILILGGTPFQIPAIKYARSAGYYVITCDFVPANPGHQLADEYHNISTTDLEGVLALSIRLKVDGILAYASDPAAPTAAFASEKLGLPGNPYDSVRLMAHKDKYRAFLAAHGFESPRAVSGVTGEDARSQVAGLNFPLMVKPVDSSGSKGVSKIETIGELGGAIEHANQFSRAKRVVVEEFLSRKGPQIGGEAFVVDGRVVFACLGDQLVDATCNPYVPAGMTFPSKIAAGLAARIVVELQRLITALNFLNGGLNLEIMLDERDRIFLMEVGPRTGGNFLPELVHRASGFNLAAAAVESALGHSLADRLPATPLSEPTAGYAYYAIHASHAGILRALNLDPNWESNVLEQHLFIPVGGAVQAYNGSNCTIGILLLRFATPAEMQEKMAGVHRAVTVEIVPAAANATLVPVL